MEQGQAHVEARLRRLHARVVRGSKEDGREGGTWQRDREDPPTITAVSAL